MIPPSIVLVLYGMIARQPVRKLWLAGIGPGILLTLMFLVYILVRCHLNPKMGPALDKSES